MTPALLMSMTASRALSFDYISGGNVPEWTPEDLAMACQGLSRRCFTAFSYRWALDDSMRSHMYSNLFNAAVDLAVTERWPMRVEGQRYIESLVWIAIAEERQPMISQAKCWAAFIRLPVDDIRALSSRDYKIKPFLTTHTIAPDDEKLWSQVSRRYEGVRGIIESWCHEAAIHVSNRIRNLDEELDEE